MNKLNSKLLKKLLTICVEEENMFEIDTYNFLKDNKLTNDIYIDAKTYMFLILRPIARKCIEDCKVDYYHVNGDKACYEPTDIPLLNESMSHENIVDYYYQFHDGCRWLDDDIIKKYKSISNILLEPDNLRKICEAEIDYRETFSTDDHL